jgi:hypothetical protein
MMPDRIRYRKRKTTRVLGWNPHNWDAEPGDLMVRVSAGRLFRLEAGVNPSAADGHLYPREIKRDGYRIEWADDGELYWVKNDE